MNHPVPSGAFGYCDYVGDSDRATIVRQLLESAGVGKDAAWYADASRNRSVKQIVDLPGGVPIRVF